MGVDLFDRWFDSIETEVRGRARGFIEERFHGDFNAVLARPQYEPSTKPGDEGKVGVADNRHGSRARFLTGTFGPIEIAVPYQG